MIRQALLFLYPRAWRDRYGDEFLELLEQVSITLPVLIDIVRGSIDAHLHPSLARSRRRKPGWIVVAAVAMTLYGPPHFPSRPTWRYRLVPPPVSVNGL